jgi:hypothetical protein
MRTVPNTRRSSAGCLCCGSSSLLAETTLVSAFLASRAWGGKPELTRLLFCRACGFRFFDRGLSSDEAAEYYADYRSENYFRERNRFEPFYTEKAHHNIHEWLYSKGRRVAVSHALDLAGAPRSFAAALDYGGGRGQMLLDLTADCNAVFDFSGDDTEEGIMRLDSHSSLGNTWDLILCCQVLEHVTDLISVVRDLTQALAKGGWLYVEVPDEIWSNMAWSGNVRDRWLAWLENKPRLLCAADCLSTAFRIKTGVLPPMGFVPMREHLNYFTVEALNQLLTRSGVPVAWSGKNLGRSVCAVARKN